MTFQEALAGAKKEVERGLVAFFAKKRQEAKQISPHCLMLAGSIAEFTMRGGKRTRAFLCWLGHRSVIPAKAGIQRKNWIPDLVGDDKLICAMMALELFQSFALIHDDIIDEDTIRRGGPTVHAKLGVPMAILAGDLALVWADELINNIQYPMTNDQFDRTAKRIVDPNNIYQKMKEEVILGQSLDVLAKEGKPSADRVTINRYKTAWYSVIRPLQIGAALGGANEKTLETFVPYGLAVGQAYQLRDDVLDGTITESDFKKQVKHLKIPRFATPMFQAFAQFVIERDV